MQATQATVSLSALTRIIRDLSAQTHEAATPLADEDPVGMGHVYRGMLSDRRMWSNAQYVLMAFYIGGMGKWISDTLDHLTPAASMVSIYPPHSENAAAYVMLSYCVCTNIYAVLALTTLYYFNRTEAYVRFHVEPGRQSTGWVAYRTESAISGAGSNVITTLSALVVLGLPCAASLFLLVYACWAYPDHLLNPENPWAMLASGGCLIAWLFAANQALQVRRHAKDYLLDTPAPSFSRDSQHHAPAFRELLSRRDTTAGAA